MEYDYDIMDDDFVIFFISHTGYVLTSCQVGWKRVREELAAPGHDIDPGGFRYLRDGSPVPVDEGEKIKATWELTRKKIQESWDVYCGRISIRAAHRKRMSDKR